VEEVANERVRSLKMSLLCVVGDGHHGQLIGSTIGDLIAARRVTMGSRSTQQRGHMSDVTLQQLSRDHGRLQFAQDGPVQYVRGADLRTDMVST